jgi:hypothetical protein
MQNQTPYIAEGQTVMKKGQKEQITIYKAHETHQKRRMTSDSPQG